MPATSPSHSPGPSRGANSHAPHNPSGLRESHTPSSPDLTRHAPPQDLKDGDWEDLPPAAEEEGSNMATSPSKSSIKSDHEFSRGIIPTIRTRLFGRRHRHHPHDGHEASPLLRPHLKRNYGSTTTLDSYDSRDGYGGPHPHEHDNGTISPHAMLGDAVTDGLLGGLQHSSTTEFLAKTHGVKHRRAMYVNIFRKMLQRTDGTQVLEILSSRHQLDPTVSLEIHQG